MKWHKLLGIFLWISISAYSDEPNWMGKEAPSFVGRTLSGELFDLSKLRGKWVVLDFWSSRSPESRQEIPFLSQAYERFHSAGLEIVGVNWDENTETIKKFLTDANMPWIHLRNIGNKISDLYKVRKIPARFLIDPTGRVVGEGSVLSREKLISALELRFPGIARLPVPTLAPTPTLSPTPKRILHASPTPSSPSLDESFDPAAALQEISTEETTNVPPTRSWKIGVSSWILTIAMIGSFLLRICLLISAYNSGMFWLFVVGVIPCGDLIFIWRELNREERNFFLVWWLINMALLVVSQYGYWLFSWF